MNKLCTSIEQSKKLIELGIDVNTADMFYADLFVDNKHKYVMHPLESYGFKTFKDTNGRTSRRLNFIPCWSLAALLGVLPKSLIYTPNQALDGYCCKNIMHDLETYGDNPVDACVAMIEKLHELKIL